MELVVFNLSWPPAERSGRWYWGGALTSTVGTDGNTGGGSS